MATDPRASDAAPRRIHASALPFAVIAITFFLPFTETCNHEVTSPLRESTSEPGAFFVLAPTFFTAAVLFVAIAYAFATKRFATRAALGAVAWNLLAAACLVVAGLGKDKAWLLFIVTAACAPLYAFAWSSRGVRRLSLLVDAYVFASLPVVALVTMSARFYGAYVFLAAFALLVVVRAIELMSRGVEALRGAPRERAPGRRPAR